VKRCQQVRSADDHYRVADPDANRELLMRKHTPVGRQKKNLQSEGGNAARFKASRQADLLRAGGGHV
jgi:hypothetical protein